MYHGGYQQHAAYYNGPPRARKAANGAIITKYPPPPGYTAAPGQPQMPYGQPHGWQGYNVGYNGLPNAPTCGGVLPPTPQYSPEAAYSHLQSGYFPQLPQSTSTNSWPPIPQSANPSFPQHNSLPYSGIAGAVLDGNGDPLALPDLLSENDSLESEFDSECYFAQHPNEIDPSLSLGVIEWKPPLPTKRALPAIYADLEKKEGLAARPNVGFTDEMVSQHLPGPRSDSTILGVKQTQDWPEAKDDPIFREFTAVCDRLISLQEMLTEWRDRVDVSWAEGSRLPTPALSRGPTPAGSPPGSIDDEAMEMDETSLHLRNGKRQPQQRDSGESILDELEAALRCDSRHSMPPEFAPRRDSRSSVPPESRTRPFSRAGSVPTQHRRQNSKTTRPKPLPPIRDQEQEDMLAALGVTGSPKLVYETPGPAFGPRPSTAGSDMKSRTGSFSSVHSSTYGGLPAIREHDRPYAMHALPDYEPDDNATPRPTRLLGDVRKRSYADTEAGATFEDVEETPRQKSKHARVG